MSLIHCPECEKQFSDKAAACPNCACPTQHATSQCKRIILSALPNLPDDKNLENIMLALSPPIFLGLNEDDKINLKKEYNIIDAAMTGLNSPCHICGDTSEKDFVKVPFGMANIISEETDYSTTALSIGLAAITLAFVGAGRISKGIKTRAKIIELKLVLCQKCKKERKSIWMGKFGWPMSMGR